MKIQVSQDTLYQYLMEHDVIITRLAEMMKVSTAILTKSFRHDLNRLGKPMKLSAANLERLNAVLPQLADELKGCILAFGSPQTYANQQGSTYDPALILPVKQGLGKYFKLKGMTERLLGWNRAKWNFILSAPSSKIYGHITKEDADRLNVELLSVAGVLSSYEVVEQNPDKQKPETKINKGTPAEGSPSVGQGVNAWDDTTLDLWERYAAFHHFFPDGLIAFAVNDGFTVCEDDARLLARIDTTLQPYTDPATGHVTLYMDAAKWQRMRRAWDYGDDGDEMIAETPMYAE